MEISDYSLQEGSLTNGSASVVLNSTASRGCITIGTVNDQIPEQMESLRISLIFVDDSDDQGIFSLDPNRMQTVVVILDNTGSHCITVVFIGSDPNCCILEIGLVQLLTSAILHDAAVNILSSMVVQ